MVGREVATSICIVLTPDKKKLAGPIPASTKKQEEPETQSRAHKCRKQDQPDNVSEKLDASTVSQVAIPSRKKIRPGSSRGGMA